MRPTTEWTETSVETAAYLREHGVRVKRRFDREQLTYVYRAPTWAVAFYRRHLRFARDGKSGRHRDLARKGVLRRALRRAARDPEFRSAFEAAAAVGLECEFVWSQEQKLDD